MDAYIGYLAEGIANVVNVFRSQAVILGGGVCAQGAYLTAPLQKKVHALCFGNVCLPEILVAALGNDAGILGAASLVM